MNKEEIIDYILGELSSIYKENELDDSVIDKSTIIFGSGSSIDSLDLVGLIVSVEEHVLEKLDKEIQVIDEDSIIVGKTPFENAESLASLVLSKISREG